MTNVNPHRCASLESYGNSSRCAEKLAVLAYRAELPSLLPIVPPPLRKSVLSESSLLPMAFLDVNDETVVLCEDQLSFTLFEVPKILSDWVAIKAVEQTSFPFIYIQYLQDLLPRSIAQLIYAAALSTQVGFTS